MFWTEFRVHRTRYNNDQNKLRCAIGCQELRAVTLEELEAQLPKGGLMVDGGQWTEEGCNHYVLSTKKVALTQEC